MSFIGTASWSIPARYRHLFPSEGGQLERYASRLNCVEINSSFYRSHQRKTYQRWAASVPGAFRFSVKMPRTITHDRRLSKCEDLVEKFLSEVEGLGAKLGMLLVQLPPSLRYEADVAAGFFCHLRELNVTVACEARHASWFTGDADAALGGMDIVRVAADPSRALKDGEPGGMTRVAYWRLHGSPRIYYSNYEESDLRRVSERLRPSDWCIFDNTAAFHALGNALCMTEFAESRQGQR